MRSWVTAILLGVLLFLVPRNAPAYNILALDMGGYWNNLADQFVGANPGMGAPRAPGQRWFTMVSYQDLATTNLMNFDVFLVQSGFVDDNVTQPATGALDALAAKAADIAGFVQAGRGLVSWGEPFPNGADWTWPWSPVDLTSRGIFHENQVEIVDPSHPVMQGLTDGALSNWQSSWHGYFKSWDPRLELLARTGDYGNGDPRTHQALTLAGAYDPDGLGRMVFSMQDPDYHAYQGFAGARLLIDNALDWAAAPIPEPSTGLLLAGGLGIAAVITRRRARGRRTHSRS